ncbi:glycosyl hydrolase family 8 [Salipiger sp.]|uniref:glycosyl hydrolase family 8 n=1 Tax=Salipiger sp. TaxID=2078585 RepID=UPI003A980762
MQRRTLLTSLMFLPLTPAAAGSGTALDAWQQWAERFVTPEGRVVDDGQGGISHSEGQGYGLVLAQAFGDRDRFRRIEDWTREHLAIRQDALMAWKWHPDHGVEDWHNATDGDLFRAWALLRAARDSGWDDREETLAAIIRDLLALGLASDPRAEGEPLITPGAEALRSPERLLVNPSYVMSRALRELGDHAKEPRLVRAADHGETLLRDLAAGGFLPDWIEITRQGIVAPGAHDFRSGYDALRIPLYLVWSGQAGHPAVAAALRGFDSAATPGHLAVVLDPSGQVLAESDLPGYRAVRDLAAGSEIRTEPGDMARQPYYPATLQMLAMVAQRESSPTRRQL